jgi:hypothetical protein
VIDQAPLRPEEPQMFGTKGGGAKTVKPIQTGQGRS